MNNKNKLILTGGGGTNRVIVMALFFLAIGMLSLGTVSAATDHSVSGSNFQSVQDVIDSSASGDRILLGNKTYTSSGSRIRVSNNMSLTIQGSSNTNRATLNANNLHGILYIQSGSSATIRYVNFVKGAKLNNESANHALGAYGTVLIENCDFSGSTGDSGSAIYVNTTAPNTIIRSCNFINNYADNHGDNDYTAGGAVCVNGADNTEISNCYFSGNTALNHGGALTIRNNAVNVRVTSCNFVNNEAPNGGAIFNHLASTTISGCTFTGNQATDSGGAIYLDAPLNIISSTFNNNYANTGGAIFSADSLTIAGSTFTSNSAINGGAIYSTSTLAISSSNFSNNNALSNGGAIFSADSLTISGSTFTSNSAINGGGIYSINQLILTDSSLSLNTATTGGAIYSTNLLTVDNTKFTGNNAMNKGGAIYTNNILNANNLNFTENSANDGGAIWGDGKSDILNSNFNNNSAISTGGAIHSSASSNITNGKFYSNHAANGGAIYTNSILNIYTSDFNQNNANGSGGAIFSTNILNINRSCSFKFNNAYNGGAIFSNNTVNILTSFFDSNIAINFGGSIFSSGILNIKGSLTKFTIFNSNKADSGSAIYLADANLNLSVLFRFSNNVAAGEKIRTTVPDFVNISDIANIDVSFGSGDNLFDALYSNNFNKIHVNGITPILTPSRVSGQNYILELYDKAVVNVADDYGRSALALDTFGLIEDTHSVVLSLQASGLNEMVTTTFKLKTTMKVEVVYSYFRNETLVEKSKAKFQAKATKYISTKVQYQRTYWEPYKQWNSTKKKYVDMLRPHVENGNKIVQIPKKYWLSIKKGNKKYKWYKQRYYYVYKHSKDNATKLRINGVEQDETIEKVYFFKNSSFKTVKGKSKDYSRYVLPSIDCECDNEIIKALSNTIVRKYVKGKKTDSKKANAILKWVQKYLTYERYTDTRKGAFETLTDSKRKGNCVDSTHLTVALLRAQNIPAQYGHSPGHLWPMARINGKWKAGEATLDKGLTEPFGGKFGKENFGAKDFKTEKWTIKYVYVKKWGTTKTWAIISESYYYNSKEYVLYVF